MWRITLFCNTLLLGLFWLLSYVIITPLYNYLVQYAEPDADFPLPLLTQFAMEMQTAAVAVPLVWGGLTLVLGWWLGGRSEKGRDQWVLTHLSITLCLGLALLVFFTTATILPILQIGAIQL